MTDLEQRKVFSNNLNDLLNAHQLTQREVANSIGVSAQTFNTWCKGIAIPRMDKIQKLADYFHIEKSSLIDSPSETPRTGLSASEQTLLREFRQLNSEGQDKAIDYVSDLVSTGRYIKDVSNISETA